MSDDRTRAAHEAHEDERNRLAQLSKHEKVVRERERERERERAANVLSPDWQEDDSFVKGCVS